MPGSKFTRGERIRYMSNNRDHLGRPLEGGWLTLSATGKYDEAIEVWLNRRKGGPSAAPRVDVSKCPDCGGTGVWYLGGYDKGAAKCTHPKLRKTEPDEDT